MEKILYISYDGMTDPLGQSQVIPYLIGLSKKGYLFHLISCEKKEQYAENEIYISDLLKKNNIKWHPISYTKTPPILSTLWDIFRINKKAVRLHKKEKFAIVHCRSYIASLIGLKLKKKYGNNIARPDLATGKSRTLKFIFDMRGFWADERVEGKIWNTKNPIFQKIFRFFKNKEKEFLLNSDSIISLTHSAKNEMEGWKISPSLPIEVIPCCVDTDFFSAEKISADTKNNLKNKLKISETDFLLSYLGSIGTWYLLDEMLLFFKALLGHNQNSKFLFITHENPETIFKKALHLNIDSKKIIVKKASRKEVPALLNLSHASIFFIKPVYSKKASSPTKLGEIMAMGIPCICNPGIGDVAEIINESKGGILVKDFTSEEFNFTINLLPGFISKDKNPLRASAINNFSIDKGIHSYNKIYRRLLLN